MTIKEIFYGVTDTTGADEAIRKELQRCKRSLVIQSLVPKFINYQVSGGTKTLEEFAETVGDCSNEINITDTDVAEFKKQHWEELREALYPPITELADALVKNDSAQLEAYRQNCLEVKKWFPKI